MIKTQLLVGKGKKRDSNSCHVLAATTPGLRNTRMTESPLRNILAINLFLLTGRAFFFPFPAFGVSVHISLTFSKTMLKCRSKAFTLARSLRLLRQLMSTLKREQFHCKMAKDTNNEETDHTRVKEILVKTCRTGQPSKTEGTLKKFAI